MLLLLLLLPWYTGASDLSGGEGGAEIRAHHHSPKGHRALALKMSMGHTTTPTRFFVSLVSLPFPALYINKHAGTPSRFSVQSEDLFIESWSLTSPSADCRHITTTVVLFTISLKFNLRPRPMRHVMRPHLHTHLP